MTCPMCGAQFEADQAQRACKACPLGGGCEMICCPSCDYRLPAEPPLLAALRGWWRSLGDGGPAPTGPATRRDG